MPPIPARERIEGVSGFIAGQNASVQPPLLPVGQYWRGLNVDGRGGLPKTRPRFIRFTSLGTGKFSGLFNYSLDDADRLIMPRNGEIIMLRLSDGQTSTLGNLNLVADYMPFWFCKAQKFLIVQNGVDWPLIINKETAVDQSALPDHERFPAGRAMAFGQTRNFVVTNVVYDQTTHAKSVDLGFVQFRASPPYLPTNPEAFLRFNEEQYYNGGGAIGMPQESGFINSLIFQRNAPTGTGYGQLLAIARKGVSGFNVILPRSEWANQQLGQVLFFSNGTEAPLSPIAVNDDIVYRSGDGVRSLRYTAAQVASGSGMLSNPPMSKEVDYILRQDPVAAHTMCSSAVLKERLFMLTGAYLENGEVFFRGFVTYNANLVSGVTSTPSVGWDGFWSGPSMKMLGITTALYDGRERLFVVAREGSENILFYLDEDDDADAVVYSAVYDDTDKKPLCRVTYGRKGFESSNVQKKFDHITVWVSALRGDCSLTLYWRPDGYPLWQEGQTVNLKGPVDTSPWQDRPGIRLGPANARAYCPMTNRDLQMGCSFQFALEWRGTLTVEQVELVTNDIGTDFKRGSDPETLVPLVEDTHGYKLTPFDYDE